MQGEGRRQTDHETDKTVSSSKKPAGGVAAGHALTARAAAEVLADGGNAFDAALAAMCTACVAEPVLASFGGGGFMVARPVDGAPVLFDFFAQTPKTGPGGDARDFYPIVADFGAARQEFHIGLGAMATPGVVHGLFAIHDAFGRIPLARLVEPAIDAARNGFELTPFQEYLFQVVGPIYMVSSGARAVFASRRDPARLLGAGETFRTPETADFLETLVGEGPRLFYEGEVAERIVETCRTGGGLLTVDDFADYRTVRRAPLTVDWQGGRLLTNPPPGTGGTLVAFTLKLLENSPTLADDWGAPAYALALAGAMDLTNAARRRAVGRDGGDVSLTELLTTPILDDYRRDLAAALVAHPQVERGTTHISVIDGDGNAAALSLSNGEGCGYVVPGTGVMMNNMLGEEDINPWGVGDWPTDRRMGSMMSPSVLTGSAGTVALGSGGSNRIRTAVSQVLLNLGVFGLSVREAVEAPRLHLERGHLDVEPGWSAETIEALASAHGDHRLWPDRNLFFGGVHAVRRVADGTFDGAGDPRRGGVWRAIGGD